MVFETPAALHATTAPVPDAHGTVVLVHGLGEHSGRYAHVIDVLNRARWSVVAYDQSGFGRSPGARGALPHQDALLDNLAQILDGIHAKKRVLLGHSMGGAVAARFVAEEVRHVDALILSSPALKAGLNLAGRLKLKIGEIVAPSRAIRNGLDPTKVSHDPAVVKAYIEDPLNHDLTTPRLVRFILDSGHVARARAKQWRVPTLLMWAGDDHIVDANGSREFAKDAPKDLVTAREFPGLYHEIFNEREPAVFETMRDWLARTCGAGEPIDPMTTSAPRDRPGALACDEVVVPALARHPRQEQARGVCPDSASSVHGGSVYEKGESNGQVVARNILASVTWKRRAQDRERASIP